LAKPSRVAVVPSMILSTLIPFGKIEKAQLVRLPDGSHVEVAKRSMEFSRCVPLFKVWGKPIIDVNGEKMCPETAVAKMFRDRGWEAVWISRNRYIGAFPPLTPCELSTKAEAELLKVRANRNFTGCWDVFAFKRGRVLFVECKGNDRFRPSQYAWLAAALGAGFTLENFLILQFRLRSGLNATASAT
jgi:hypothetical protein